MAKKMKKYGRGQDMGALRKLAADERREGEPKDAKAIMKAAKAKGK